MPLVDQGLLSALQMQGFVGPGSVSPPNYEDLEKTLQGFLDAPAPPPGTGGALLMPGAGQAGELAASDAAAWDQHRALSLSPHDETAV